MLQTKVYNGIKCAVLPNPKGGKSLAVGPKKMRATLKHGAAIAEDFLGKLVTQAIFNNVAACNEWLANPENMERVSRETEEDKAAARTALPQTEEAVEKATVQEHLDTNNDELAQLLAKLSS